jgi:hypothetical protein
MLPVMFSASHRAGQLATVKGFPAWAMTLQKVIELQDG